MTELPTVSVLIGTRDRLLPLTRCLKSILSQDYPNLELIVLDDCSEQKDIPDVVASQLDCTSVRFMRSAVLLGVAGGRNLLIQEAPVAPRRHRISSARGVRGRLVQFNGLNAGRDSTNRVSTKPGAVQGKP